MGVVFAQWIPILSILGRMLFQAGFKFVYLRGEMEPAEQEASIKAFRTVPEINIIVRARAVECKYLSFLMYLGSADIHVMRRSWAEPNRCQPRNDTQSLVA